MTLPWSRAYIVKKVTDHKVVVNFVDDLMTQEVENVSLKMMPPEIENWSLMAYEVHLKERVKSAEIQMLSKDDTEIKLKVLAPTSGSYQIIGNLLINRPKDV